MTWLIKHETVLIIVHGASQMQMSLLSPNVRERFAKLSEISSG